MRISDWSSDVCSSDLRANPESATRYPARTRRTPRLTITSASSGAAATQRAGRTGKMYTSRLPGLKVKNNNTIALHPSKIGKASCRERVCQYVSISVCDVSYKKKKTITKKQHKT